MLCQLWKRHLCALAAWLCGPRCRSISQPSRPALPVRLLGLEALENRLAPARFHWNINADGNWDNSANWYNDTAGAVSGFPNASDDVATFGNAITGPHTVTIPNGVTITVGTINFDNANAYTVTRAGTGNLVLDVSSGNASLNVTAVNGNGAHILATPITLADSLIISNSSTGPMNISGVIGESAAGKTLNKTGTGALVLTAANTYSGNTTVEAGALTLSGAGTALSTAFTVKSAASLTLDNSGTNNTNRISNSNALTLNGGEFIFRGSNSAAASETVGPLTLGDGASTVTVLAGSGGSTILTFTNASRTAGATFGPTVLFRGASLGSNPAANVANIKFNVATNLNLKGGGGSAGSTAINIIPWAIGDTSATGSGIGFVTNNTDTNGNTNGIRPLNLSTEYASLPTTTNGDLFTNYKVTATTTNNASGGFSANSLLVSGGSTLTIGSSAPAKTLTLNSGAIISASGAANTLAGNGGIVSSFGEFIVHTTGDLTVGNTSGFTGSGVILTKGGSGTLTYGVANSYTGLTCVNTGTLRASANDQLATGPLTVDGPAAVFDLGANHTDTVGTVTVANGGAISGTGTSALTSTGTFEMQSGSVSAILAGANIALNKTMSGTVTLSGTNTYTGPTTVSAGNLRVAGMLANPGGTVTVQSGGTLSGGGTVDRNVQVLSGGTLSPGSSAGILNTRSLALESGAVYLVDLNSPYAVAGTDYDQANVTGTVTLNGATLSLVGGNATPSGNGNIVIISNDGSDAITGTPGAFAGLPEGATVVVGTFTGKLSYLGGSNNNDVVLTFGSPAATTISLDGSGNLVVADAAGKDDNLTLQSDTANNRFLISDPNFVLGTSIPGASGNGSHNVSIPFTAVTGSQIFVNTLGGNDRLTIDFSLGLFGKQIAYDGGNPTTGPGDSLKLTGGSFATITDNCTGAGTGNISLTGSGTIAYTGLEPVDLTGTTAIDLVFSLTTGADLAVLEDDGTSGNGVSQLRSANGTFELTTFTNPTGSLTINGGAGNDTITVTALDLNSSLIINGEGGTDAININTNLTLGSATSPGNLTLGGENFSIAGSISTNAGAAPGSITLTATVGVDLGENVAFNTDRAAGADGNISISGPVNADVASQNRSLTLTAGGGTIAVNNNVGATRNLGAFTIISAASASVGRIDTRSGGIALTATAVSLAGNLSTNGLATAGPVSISGAVTLAGNVQITTTATTSGNISFAGSASTINSDTTPRTLTLAAGNGAITLGGAVGGARPLAALTITAGGLTTLGGNITTDDVGGSGTVDLSGAAGGIALAANITVNTDAAGNGTGGNITLGSAIDSSGFSRSVSLTAATGVVSLSGVLGASNPLTTFTVVSAGSATFAAIGGSSAGVTGNVQVTTTGTVTFNGGRIGGSLAVTSATIQLNSATLTVGSGPALTADNIAISAGLAAGASTVYLLPRTAGNAINLGGADAPGVLGLTNSELNLIAAGTIVIGDSRSGQLRVTDFITRPAQTKMELHSAGAIVFDPGALDTAGGNLLLSPGVGGVQPLSSGTDISAATVSFASDLTVAINGTEVDSGYSRLQVNGSVDLSSANLALTGSYVPVAGDVFVIVSATAINGRLLGLSDGATVNFNGTPLRITYSTTAVTLSVAATQVRLDAGNLVIEDVVTGGKSDALTIQADAANSRYLIRDPSNFLTTTVGTQVDNHTVSVPFAAVTGNQIQVNTRGGSDSLTVDFSLGNFAKAIVYDGGESGGDDDRLIVMGYNVDQLHLTHTGAESGALEVGAGAPLLSFDHLEPVGLFGTATDLIIDLPADVADAVLSDDAIPNNGLSQIASASGMFEATTFSTPIGSLTIQGAAMTAETLDVRGLDMGGSNAGFAADLILDLAGNTGSGTDAVNFNTQDLLLVAGKSLVVSAQTIQVGVSVAISGAGQISLRADNMDIAATAAIGAGTGTANLTPASSGTMIALGGADGAGLLGLTDAELNRVTAGTINLGDANTAEVYFSQSITRRAAADINIRGSAIDFANFGLDTGGGNATLTTSAAGGILAGAGSVTNVTANILNVAAGAGGIGQSSAPLRTAVSSLSTDTAGTGADQYVQEADTLHATSLDAGAGTITLVGGTFVAGSIFSNLFVQAGATLAGVGTVAAGTTTTFAGGAIAPGDSPGILNTGAVVFASGSVFAAEVGGPVAGFDYDQINVTGSVALGAGIATLNLLGGYAAVPGQVIGLIRKDGTDPVSGFFAGLPAGASVSVGDFNGIISYAGNDGNDVTLTVPGAIRYTVTEGGASFIVRRNNNGTPGDAADDLWQLLRDGILIDSRPLAAVSSFSLHGQDNVADDLTVDFSFGGFFALSGGISFEGGAGGNDRLIVTGGSFTSVVSSFTSAGAGTLVYDNGVDPTLQINYTGLEPLDMSGSTIADLVFNLPAGADTAFLEDDATAGNGISRIRSSPVSFEQTDFANPTNSLTINLGDGDDALALNSPQDFSAALTMDGQAGNDTLVFNSSVNLSGSLRVTSEAIQIKTTALTTAGDQTYAGAVKLGTEDATTITLTATGGTVSFTGTVDAAAAGQQALAIAGNASFGGGVGSTALRSLSVSGSTALDSGAITTTNAAGGTGNQTYTGPATLGAADGTTVTLTATGGSVLFGSTLDAATVGQQGLVIAGNASFAGVVGGVALRSLSVSGASALNTPSINTSNITRGSGDQTYVGAVTLGAVDGTTASLTATGGTVAFGGTVDATAAGQQGLAILGNASFAGTVGATPLRSLSVSGTTALATLSIVTTNIAGGSGEQRYAGAVMLGTANGTTVTLGATGGAASFGGTVDAASAGQQGLTIIGNALFADAVGGVALRSLSVSGASAINTTFITTTNAAGGSGNQSYVGAVTLGVGNGSTVTLTGTGGTVAFGGTVDATAEGQQALAIIGNASFGGAVGTTALRSLSVSGTTAINTTSIITTNIAGGSGDQTYIGTITLGTANGTSVGLTATGGTVSFGSALDASAVGQQGLTITGNASFGGAVGTTPLRSLSVSGATALHAPGITTSAVTGGNGNQAYSGPVTLGAANGATVALTATGGTVAFGSTVNAASAGQQGLTIIGNALFADAVGGVALRSLSVSGASAINTTSITTTNAAGGSGNQSYVGAVTLGVGNGSTVTLTGTGGTVAFGGTVDATAAGQQGLAILGNASFAGTVGATPLRSLSVSGRTAINTTFIITTNIAGGAGNQSYLGAVTLGGVNGGTLTLTATGGTVSFGGTVDAAAAGQQSLAIIGNASVAGTVGATPLRSLLVSGASAINTTSITTTNAAGGSGNQSYVGAVTLGVGNGSTVTLTGTGGTVAFGGTVDATAAGQQGLAILGNASFAGTVGATPLRSLSVSGTTAINTTSIITTNIAGGAGNQSYLGAVTLGGVNGGTLTLTATGGTVSFGGTLDAAALGQQGLSIAGKAVFGGVVGATPLRELSIAGTTTIATTSITTSSETGGSGKQTFTGAVTLESDATLTALGTGDITFASTVDGAFDLSIESNGTTAFIAAVGGSIPLDSLTTDASGTTQIGGDVHTQGGTQVYDDPIFLIADVSITDTGGTGVLFNNSVDSDGTSRSLTVTTTEPAAMIQFGDAVGTLSPLNVLTFNNAGPLVFEATADVSLVGAFTQIGTGPVALAANIATTGDLSFAAAVTLTGDVRLDSGAGGGDIDFAGSIDGAFDLAMHSGAGGVNFGDSVGSSSPLANLLVNTEALGGLTLDQDVVVTGRVILISMQDGVTQTGGSLATSELLLQGAGTFAIGSADNNVDTLAADLNAGSLSFVDADDLAVGTVTFAGIATGNPLAGGNVTITAGGTITVEQPIDTSTGTGGVLTVSGSVVLNASLRVGAGAITLNGAGGTGDLVINASQTSTTPISLTAPRDIIVAGALRTTGPAADILLHADSDHDGVGGVWIQQPAGMVDARRNIHIQGADLFATAAASDSVRVDGPPSTDRIMAAGTIALEAGPSAPAAADILLGGAIRSSGGSITVAAADTMELSCTVNTAGGDIRFLGPVVLTGPTFVTTGGASAGDIFFDGGLSSRAVEGAFPLDLTAGAGSITFNGDAGAVQALASILIQSAFDVKFAGTIQTTGDVIEIAGTGLTTFHGTSGSGVGGSLLVNADAIAFDSANMKTAGPVALIAQNAVSFNAGLDAGASTIAVAANQDGSGAEGFTQTGGALHTTNSTATAITIAVNTSAGGSGDARVQAIAAGLGSTITISVAGGALLDGNAAATNITCGSLNVTADAGIGTTLDPIETAVTTLSASAVAGGIFLANAGALEILSAAGAGMAILSAASPLTVSGDVLTGGDIFLTAGEKANDPACLDDLALETGAAIQSTGGSITLHAGDDVILNTGASILAALDIDLVAGFANADNCGDLLVFPSITISAGTDIRACSYGDLAASGMTAGGTVTLRSENGQIHDANGAARDITAAALAMQADAGIGAGDPLETAVANLEAKTDTGGISVVNTGPLTIGGVTPGTCISDLAGVDVLVAGDIALSNFGDIHVLENLNAPSLVSLAAVSGSILDANGSGNDFTAANLLLQADDAIGAAGNPLDAAVGALEAKAGGGGVFVVNAGSVTIGGVSPLFQGIAATGTGIRIQPSGALHLDENAIDSGTGDVELRASDELIIGLSSSVTVRAVLGNILLQADDDATLSATSTVQASGVIAIKGDQGDPDPAGALITVNGTNFVGTALSFSGGNQSDTFALSNLSLAMPTSLNGVAGATDVATLDNVIMNGSASFGLFAQNLGIVQIRHSSFTGNLGDGMELQNVGNITLDTVTANANSGLGFQVASAGALNLSDLIVKSNGAGGGRIQSVGTVSFTPTSGAAADTVTLTASSFQHTRNADAQQAIFYGGVANLYIFGEEGADIFDIQGTSTPTFIDAGAGDDTINISSDAPNDNGDLNALQGPLTVEAGAGDFNQLIVSDASGAGNPDVVLSDNQITGLAPATITYRANGGHFQAAGGDGIVLRGSDTEGDFFTIASTLAGSTTRIEGLGGADTFVNAGALGDNGDLDDISGPLTIVGGDPGPLASLPFGADPFGTRDVLFLNDRGAGGLHDYLVTPTGITGLDARAFAGVSFDGTMDFVRLDGTDDENVFDVSPSLTTQFFIDGNLPSSGEDASGGGDFLRLETEGTTGRVMRAQGSGAGVWSFTSGHQAVGFESIERFNHVDIMAVANENGPPLVRVYDAETFQFKFQVMAYEPYFRGGVRVAAADVNCDGLPDLIVTPGPGRAPTLKIFDGAPELSSGHAHRVLASFNGFAPQFTKGVFVAAGDVNADGRNDIIVGADAGWLPQVRVYDGRHLFAGHPQLVAPFLAFANSVRSGVRVAAGDLDGDRRAEIIAASGPGMSAVVSVFDGATLRRVQSFSPFGPSYKNGLFVAVGDVNGDSVRDVIASVERDWEPWVGVVDGYSIYSGQVTMLAKFLAFAATERTGVRVAVKPMDGTSRRGVEKVGMLLSSGPQGGVLSRRVRFARWEGLTPSVVDRLFQDAKFDGIFVG